MDIIFVILILLFSVVIHEVAHGYAALWLGDQTAKYEGRLSLNPIKHLDLFGSFIVPLLGYFTGGFIIGWAKPVPFNPYNLRNQKWGEAVVAISGPLSNILIAFIFSFILRISSVFLSDRFFFLAEYLIYINIILFVFNLIPIPPLDGSKVLFSIFPSRFYVLRQSFEQYGFVFVFLFLFVFWRFISPVGDIIFKWLVGVPFLT